MQLLEKADEIEYSFDESSSSIQYICTQCFNENQMMSVKLIV